jgi:hypothetical protein
LARRALASKLGERHFPPRLAWRGDGRLWSELTSSVDNPGATGSDDNDNRNAEAYSRHQHRAASSRSLVAANCPRRHRKNHHSCHGQPSLKPSSRLRATQQQMSSTSWHSPIFYGAPYSVQTGTRCADNLQTVSLLRSNQNLQITNGSDSDGQVSF